MRSEHLHEGMTVMVHLGAMAAEALGHPPLVVPGIVLGLAEDGFWWIEVQVKGAGGLPQMYRPEEILGIPFPQHQDGGYGSTGYNRDEWPR